MTISTLLALAEHIYDHITDKFYEFESGKKLNTQLSHYVSYEF